MNPSRISVVYVLVSAAVISPVLRLSVSSAFDSGMSYRVNAFICCVRSMYYLPVAIARASVDIRWTSILVPVACCR